MSSTTMHFGPEWMRTKHQPAPRAQPQPDSPSTAPSGASTYSALVSPTPPSQYEGPDEAHPFRYSRDELLRIYREGGGRGGLGLEVERWEGVVREVGSEPIGLREMSDHEKKLFQGPLNSDLRRRQSTDYLSPLSTQSLGIDRSRLSFSSPGSATGSPLRDRFGALRRRDSTEQPTVAIPRKQSLSTLQPSQSSPRETTVASPRRPSGYTPNFDGILNSGESWAARRRTSEPSAKTGYSVSREPSGDHRIESKGSEIPEEEEEEEEKEKEVLDRSALISNEYPNPIAEAGGQLLPPPPPPPDSQDISTNLSNDEPHNFGSQSSSFPPAGKIDYANVDWSYKDPSGQIQGPFNAGLMQKWCDDGYFTGDLPVKRTNPDSQWTTVEQLTRQHGGSKIFLTPPLSSLPSGLTLRPGSPQNSNLQQEQQHSNGPLQPAPIRTLRNATLESHSNPSDSPSSSYGGHFNNESPDPFGGRNAYLGDNTGRLSNFSGIPDPSLAFNRRNAFGDTSIEHSLSAQYASIPDRGMTSDGFGFNHTFSSGQNGWSNNLGATSLTERRGSADHGAFPSNYMNGSGVANVANVANTFGNLGPSQDGIFSDNISFQPLDFNQYSNGAPSAHLYSTTTTYPDSQHLHSASSHFEQHGAIPQAAAPASPNQSSNPLLWVSDVPPPRRPGPFDTPHPTSSNTVVIHPVSPWARINEVPSPASRVNEALWPTPSQSITEEDLAENLTFINVEKHDGQPQSLPITLDATNAPSELRHFSPSFPPADVSAEVPRTTPSSKAKAKASVPPLQAPPKQTSSILQGAPDAPPSASASKTAWQKDDDGKAKSNGSSMSLREIQEAETKKTEARKTTERERERTMRVAVQVIETKESSPPFIASWGLPTSQAGVVPRANGTIKEAAPTSAPPTQPVWTTTVKINTAKRTMKEIQEEEERRKKTAGKETIAAAARRAHIDTAQKVVPPAQIGGAWTTVGPSGKPTMNVASTRSGLALSASTSNISPIRANGSPAARPVASVQLVGPPIRLEDPVAPSHDFLKWLSTSLKGLNNSVNVEEIVSMLLSFPLDPDPSTVELISELIYANSTTLDGRRFAAEFISKRKADASSRPKAAGPAGKTPAKPISIADVVKAVPKPTQPEWGFKVVNKKKKGSRT